MVLVDAAWMGELGCAAQLRLHVRGVDRAHTDPEDGSE